MSAGAHPAAAADLPEALNKLMEQAQVFASTWSSVGGPFDDGSTMERAEEEKALLRSMIGAALAAPTAPQAGAESYPPMPGWRWMAHPDWNDGQPIPVQIEVEDGATYYRPFDGDATQFEWDERSNDWQDATAALNAAAPQPPAVPREQDAALSQHDADSRELRALCISRDSARKQRDLLAVDVAALESSVGTLSRLVDDLRPGHDRYQYLRDRDLNVIADGGLFVGRTPDNVVINSDDLDTAIDTAMAAKGQKGGAA